MSTIFFTILLQLMLSSKLLQLIIYSKQIIIVIFSNRKQNLGFVVKNIDVALLKKKNYKKSLVSKLLLTFTNFHLRVCLDTAYY